VPMKKPATKTSNLMLRARAFWFNNEPGPFDGGITREQVFVYGGPNPEFNGCERCQMTEWSARTQQEALRVTHNCATSSRCQELCDKQGKDEWAHYHQNFLFAMGVDPALNAPKCLMIQPPKGYAFLTGHSCDQSTQVFLRQFARACQFDLAKQGDPARPDGYDFVFFVNNGVPPVPAKPAGIPSIVYCHDLWKRKEERQVVLTAWQPDVLWTPFASSWEKHYQIPKLTKVVFRPIPASTFFTRENLTEKTLDLLVIGAAGDGIYSPRQKLTELILPLREEYAVKVHNAAGARRSKWDGPNNGEMPYGPAWSRFLGTARFVAFAGIDDDPQPVFFKFFEVLGSGAIPIMPEAPDLVRVGVRAWEHYIPIESVQTLDDFRRYLNEPGGWYHIAHAATKWHRENADRLLFDGFEDLVQSVTDWKYPRRLLAQKTNS